MSPNNDPDEKHVLLKYGGKIRAEQIYIQARRIECHKKRRAYSTHGRNTAVADNSAEAWITKELRFMRSGKD